MAFGAAELSLILIGFGAIPYCFAFSIILAKCAEDRFRVFDKIMEKAKQYGIAPNRIHIDPLIEMLCTSCLLYTSINIKDTCVLSIIGVVELFYTTKGVAGALYTYFEAFTITMVIYFVLTFTCSRILRFWESKMDGSDNYDLATTDTLAHTSGMYRYQAAKKEDEE